MDLPEPTLDLGHAPPIPTALREPATERYWRELVAQVGGEVAAPLAAALGRVSAIAATGRLDRAGLCALRDDLDQARRVAVAAQQISRFGSGRVRPQPQRCQLAPALRDRLAQRCRDSARLGIELHQDLQPAEVLIDASMLPALLQALLDWSFAQASTRLEFAIDAGPWPAHARLHCRFTRAPAEEAGTLDNTAWRLVVRLAQSLGLQLQRDDHAGEVRLTLEFPRTVGEPLLELQLDDPAPAAWADSQPMVGRHVLVVAARRETRNAVRTALRETGAMLDFVASVDEARAFCTQGLPHAIVYEAALAGDHFRRLRAAWVAATPRLSFVEITEGGPSFAAGDPGHDRTPRIGREAVADTLAGALANELAQAA